MDKSGTLCKAEALLQAGFSVLPIKRDGSKAPTLATWEEYKARRPAREELKPWFSGKAPPGIGIIGGAVSGGLLVLDFEFLDFFEEWAALVEGLAPGLVGRLPLVRTPGKDEAGGRHVYARSAGPAVPTRKLARITRAEAKERTGDPGRTTAVEVKAEKGYVLTVGCPAPCHPTGRLYEHAAGPPIEATPTISAAEAELLLACARSLERGEKASADREGPPAGGEGNRPGDDFNRRADWLTDVLQPAGWKAVRQSGEVVYVCRPGKGDGVSGTVGYCHSERAGPKLYVFSTNAEPFEAEKSYSKFEAYTLLRHGREFGAAAKDLAAQGYGEQRRQRPKPPVPAVIGDSPDAGEPDGEEIIRQFFLEAYEPIYRSKMAIFSAKLGRLVAAEEGCFAPPKELERRLAAAKNAPRMHKSPEVDSNGIPFFFRTWAKPAWLNLVLSLPEEEASAEISDARRDEFRRQVLQVLLYRANIPIPTRDRKRDDLNEIRVEQRPLIDWCELWAIEGTWRDIRGFRLWCRRDDGRLRVALKHDLCANVPCGERLYAIGSNKFTRRCKLYDVGTNLEPDGSDFKINGVRVIEVDARFLMEAVARLTDQGLARARTREETGKPATEAENA